MKHESQLSFPPLRRKASFLLHFSSYLFSQLSLPFSSEKQKTQASETHPLTLPNPQKVNND